MYACMHDVRTVGAEAGLWGRGRAASAAGAGVVGCFGAEEAEEDEEEGAGDAHAVGDDLNVGGGSDV